MKISTYLLVVALGLLVTTTVSAEIALTADEIDRLGVELVAPQLVDSVSAFDAPARVVLPPNAEVIVSPSLAGVVTRMLVTSGDQVERGDPLAEIQSTEFLMHQREFLDAVIQNNLASSQLQRDLQLFDEGIIAQRRLQDTEARAAARAGYNEHRQVLRIMGIDDAAIGTLASRQQLQSTLILRAPVDGVVIAAMAVTGERLDAMTPLYRVADLSTLWLEIDVPHEQLDMIAPGVAVSVMGASEVNVAQDNASEDNLFENNLIENNVATVTSIGSSINTRTQTALVRAALRPISSGLRPGQLLTVRLAKQVTDDSNGLVWAVPSSAVTRSGTETYVFVRTSMGFERQSVTLVGSDAKQSYISQGVTAQSRIAIRGVAALKAQWAADAEPDE